MEITVTTQAELDALPASFQEFTYIYIKSQKDTWLTINRARGNSHVVARGNSHVEAWENSHVEAWENSHVEAWGNSHVVARENSHVVARGNSHVVARGNSHVVARENSHVVARENSHVVARGNSHVVARGNSHVEAWENSHVEAWENSHVVARGNVCIWNHSNLADVVLFGFAICFALFSSAKTKIKRKSRFSKIVSPRKSKSLAEWGEINGVELKAKVIVYKRVSVDFKTQELTKNETVWTIGTTLVHSAWKPKDGECGEGKFHACPQPFFCDEFRYDTGDRYVAIEVARKDLHSWPNPEYQHKIAFRKGTVLYECDRFGNRIG
jgi:hypothetical protein